MYYIGNVVKSVAGLYSQLNSATLTGAIDIVVIKQEDGSYIGSPFHVRFGKLGVLSSREKVVDIAVNDAEVNLHMKLGTAGEAFFVEEAKERENVPSNLGTSPIPDPLLMIPEFSPLEIQIEANKEDKDSVGQVEDDINDDKIERCKSFDDSMAPPLSRSIDIPGRSNRSYSEPLDLDVHHHSRSSYALSDMDSPISSPLSSSPADKDYEACARHIFSDTELGTSESVTRKTSRDENIKWEWGMLPEGTPAKRRAKRKQMRKIEKKEISNKEGLLLEEVLAADKEVADMYLNRTNSHEDPDFGSQNDLQFRQDGSSPEDFKADFEVGVGDIEPRDVSFSLCGGLKDRKVPPDRFLEMLVPYDDFCLNPDLLHDPKLVIKIDDRYYNWPIAAPYLMSFIVYQRELSQDCMKLLTRQYMPKKRRGWFQWRTPAEDPESSDDDGRRELRGAKRSDSIDKLSDIEDFDSDIANNIASEMESFDYKKTLRLTSDQWKSLNLHHGKNKVTFTVTTRYQGTAICTARIFLWHYCDKIVISDIDGTITKSDVLGQILPAVGKDWSQTGVTGLFSKIRHNGYNFMYLSARAIGQAQLTRDFLHSVKQGELTLPDGPVLLTPTSLFKAFKKEVIERKPEEFKISCMRDIQGLFQKTSNPFYSGFGNRVNDVYAYRAVGIPISRIFTINYKGEIKHELTNTFSSSYSKLIELVDQMFPPVTSWNSMDSAQSEFTSFSYWRTPVIQLSIYEDDEGAEIP